MVESSIPPHECWFCRKMCSWETDWMSREWDSLVHEKCLRGNLKDNPFDDEAIIMAREFNIELTPEQKKYLEDQESICF